MIEILTNCAKVMGLCVVGAMIASMVSFSTPLVLTMGRQPLRYRAYLTSCCLLYFLWD